MEDEARDIHWRRSASFGRLVSRERAAEADRSLTLALDERPPTDPAQRALWDAAFEVAVSECASLAIASLAHGISVAVRAEGSESPRVDAGGVPDPLLRYLALLQPLDAAGQSPVGAAGHPARRDAGILLRIPIEPAERPAAPAVPALEPGPARGGRAA